MAKLISYEEATSATPPADGLISYEEATGATPENQTGGFMPAAKQAIGAGIKGLGQAATDFIPGVEKDNALSSYGQSVIDANPTAIRSLGDIADKPLKAITEATGNAGGSMASMLGARGVGKAMTAAAPFTGPAAPIVAGAGQLIANVGPFVAAALPSYGGIRGSQIAADPLNEQDGRSKAIALLGAGTVGAIEGSFGPQAWALAAMKKGGIEAVAKNFAAAKSLPGFIRKGALKGAAVEGAEELVQNPVEQIASYQDPTTGESLSDTALSGAMGAIGGGVLGGGMAGVSYGAREQQPTTQQQPAPQPVAPPSGPMGKAAVTAQQSGAVDAAEAQRVMQEQILRDEQQAKQKGATNEQKAAQGPIAEAGQSISGAPAGLAGAGQDVSAASDTAISAASDTAVQQGQVERGVAPSQTIGQPPIVQPQAEAQDDEAPPRVVVGKDEKGWLNQSAQNYRNQSDNAGLTKEIERLFSTGMTARQVESKIKGRLAFLPKEEITGFVVSVRATLGIPSRQAEEGKTEFAAWQAGYHKRNLQKQPKGNNGTQAQEAEQATQGRPAQPATAANAAGVDSGGDLSRKSNLVDAENPLQNNGSVAVTTPTVKDELSGERISASTRAPAVKASFTSAPTTEQVSPVKTPPIPQVGGVIDGGVPTNKQSLSVAPAIAEPAIDVSTRTDKQLAYLSTNGKPGYKEAAIAEIARRGGEVAEEWRKNGGEMAEAAPGVAEEGRESGVRLVRVFKHIKQFTAKFSGRERKDQESFIAKAEKRFGIQNIVGIKGGYTVQVDDRGDGKATVYLLSPTGNFVPAATIPLSESIVESVTDADNPPVSDNNPAPTPATAGDSVSLASGQGKETGGSLPKPTLAERKAAALERSKAKESATKAAEARTIAARAPEVIDVSTRTNQQLTHLSTNGKPGYKEAAIAEIARRGGEVAESAPDAAGDDREGGNQAPLWKRTVLDAVGPQIKRPLDPRKLPRLEKIAKERPESLTDRDRAALEEMNRAKSARSKYLKDHKAFVERSNAHYFAVQDAKARGEEIPPAVRADYPHLFAAEEQAAGDGNQSAADSKPAPTQATAGDSVSLPPGQEKETPPTKPKRSANINQKSELDGSPNSAESNATNFSSPAISKAMIAAGYKSADDIRDKISSVKFGEIVDGVATIKFSLNGEDYVAKMRGRNRDFVLIGKDSESDRSYALRALLDGDAIKLGETKPPKPTLEERKAAAIERRKAKEAATKAAEARTIAARAPEVASLADRLKAAAATAVGSRKAALEARLARLEAAKAKETTPVAKKARPAPIMQRELRKDEEAQAAKDKKDAEKQSLAEKVKARVADPDNFQFGEDSKAAAKPMGGLFDQPAQQPTLPEELFVRRGDRFIDGQGKEWEVWMARTGLIEAMPVVNGKPVVNRDSGVRFATTQRSHLANPEARTDFSPLPKEKAGVTPQLMTGDPESYIKVAADSIEKLRKDDVYRVLESNDAIFRQHIASYIKAKRRDLADEVDDALADLSQSAADDQNMIKKADAAQEGAPANEATAVADNQKLTTDIPASVRDHVTFALGKLRDIEQMFVSVERARGNGHFLALEVRDQQPKIKEARDMLTEFRQLAKNNNVDADAVIANLGGEPDFERFGKPADEASKPTVEGGKPAAEAAPAEAKAPEAKGGEAETATINDFGEKLEGARKDYAEKMRDAMDVDVASQPLSKSWPEPDYQKLLDGGADPYMVAFIRAARDELPTKPQSAWKLSGWVKQAEVLRGLAQKLLSGDFTADRVKEMVAEDRFRLVRDAVGGRAELYELVGHDRSLKGVTFASHHFSLYKGQKNVSKWTVEQKAKATAFSNWPRELAVGDTKEEALAAFKASLSSLDLGREAKRQPQFVIYRKRGEPGAWVGKKIGREYIDLHKATDVADARKYMGENIAALESALSKYKETPLERKSDNQPRVGDDHRNGSPVTPDAFSEAFGFRGVQFGNYVEQGRRQSDLNEAFDGLMDLAAVLGVPPRALSLNGQLGLAFGSRGRGGKNAPAAHFEPGRVVINLTKGGGPGSLAHEWWHSLDNYFAKQAESKSTGFVTDTARTDGLREEMRAAFAAVKSATSTAAYRRRSAELDKRRSKPYWDTPHERSARAFEGYVIAKLFDQGAANDYLANVISNEAWDITEDARVEFFGGGEAIKTYPYPTVDEMPMVRAAFDEFFKTVETKEGDNGNVVMFNQASQATITPSDSAIYDMAAEGKSAQEILAFIGSSARRPFDRYLAKALMNLGVKSTIKLDMFSGWKISQALPGKRYAAAYSPKTDTVAIFTPRGATQSVLHELVHAATLKALANPRSRAAIEMRRLFKHVQDSGLAEGMYGTRNLEEFVAEAFSNPKFQQALMSIPAPSGSSLKSAWEWFVGVVARMLGMRRPAQATALDRAMVLGAAVMNENAAIAGNATGGNRYAIAHHGTPHVFAPEPGFPHGRFRLDKMGTGEGAQAYGWGVYFAENEGVAGQYQRNLSANTATFDGKPLSHLSVLEREAADYATEYGGAQKALDVLDSKIAYGSRFDDVDWLRQVRDKLSSGRYAKEDGNIYRLDIPDDVMQKLLDWDKPLSEQPKAVRNALAGKSIKNRSGQDLLEMDPTGSEIVSALGKGEGASEYLANIGIPGLRYLDGDSRNRPLKEIKREFLNELPEDAEFSEVEDLIGTGKFSPKNDALLKALKADDWLGFDYPAQAVSAALGAHLGNFDASNELLQAVESAKEGGTHNYVIWDQKTLDRIALLERNGQALDDIRFREADDENVSGNVSGDISDTITIDGVERPRLNSNGKPIAQTDEALRKFYAWFKNSRVVDEQGRPLVVYHGTASDVANFAPGNGSSDGFHFSSSPDVASRFAQSRAMDGGKGANVVPAYLAMQNPKAVAIASNAEISDAQEGGHDGLAAKGGHYVAIGAEQIKSATGNTGEFSPDNPDIRFNAAHDWISDNSPRSVRSVVANAMHSDKATSWITPFNTQYHKAEKWAAEGKPLFKKVFDLGQRFLSDVSRFAVMAQQQAPTLFHEIKSVADAKESLSNIKSWGDITGKNHRADVDAIAAPLYEGTLYGGGSPTKGVIFSDEKLRQAYKLTDRQIKLYREALAAAGTSMDEMAKSVIARHAKQNGIDFDNALDIADMAEEVIQQLEEEKARVQKALIESQMSILKQMDGENGISGEDAEKQMRKLLAAVEKQSERIDKTIKDITGIVDKNKQLQDHGYFPLMRFGDHTVTAKDDEGNTQFFGMYEGIPLVPRSGQYQANKVAEAVRAEHPEWTVTTGIHNTEKYKLYEGMNLEAVQLFAEHMDKESLEPFQEFLRVATNDRSIMKRLIHRKGTPGFDRDIRRTLSQFIVSNARHTSSSYHMGDMRKAAEAAEQDGGDIGSEAIRLHEYVSKPKEEAQAIRGYLFFNFLGGSIASAMVNLSQVPMMTFPYLTRYEGAGALGRRLAVAARMAIKDPAKITGNLGAALQRAEQDGVTAPQEIHQLTATAANNIFAGSRLANGFLRAWGAPFAMAESFNRRTTFIAAFQIAEKMTHQELMATGTKSAFEFAEKAVTDTQGIYNKGNRMNVGRGAPGAVIMTFQQFSIMYLELLKRMPTKQRAVMLGMLLLAAGGGGLPFEEDAEDIIDTIGQWLGFGTNASKTLGNAASSVFGERAADILLKGAASQMGIDLHSRFGMGNLIPGTGALKLSSIDKSRDAVEVFGPAASVVQGVAKALENLATGHEWRAVMAVSPNMVKNLDKGVTMATTGYGEDEKGKRTVPTNELEAFSKAIGFNPKAVADYGQIKRDIAQDDRMVQVKQEEFTSAISDAILSGDTEARKEAMAAVRQWNLDNPKMIVVINPASVSKRVRDARAEGADRFLKTVSRPMRADARDALKP